MHASCAAAVLCQYHGEATEKASRRCPEPDYGVFHEAKQPGKIVGLEIKFVLYYDGLGIVVLSQCMTMLAT